MANSWTELEVTNWLRRDLQLPEYAELFLSNKVTGARVVIDQSNTRKLSVTNKGIGGIDLGFTPCVLTVAHRTHLPKSGHQLWALDDSDLLSFGVHRSLHRKRILIGLDRLFNGSRSPRPNIGQVWVPA